MVRERKPPWPSTHDIFRLRDMLYPGGPETDESEQIRNRKYEACSAIAAWAGQQTIPHAIRCTALLVEAQLCRYNESLSLTIIQTIYASVISRFVTGFVDIARAKRVTPNMYHEARKLGMPETWVDVRHRIVHDGVLPSIETFERLTQDCLEWLWKNFWKDLGGTKTHGSESNDLFYYGIDMSNPRLAGLGFRHGTEDDDAKAEETNDEETISVRDKLLDCISEFLKTRLHEIRTQNSSSSHAAQAAAPIIVDCCNGREQNARLLASIIVDVKYMIPDDRSPGDSMQGAFMIWKQLLGIVSDQLAIFRPTVLNYMVSILGESDEVYPRPYAFREAIYGWILALLPTSEVSDAPSEVMEASRRDEPKESSRIWSVVMNQCVLNPLTLWTEKLVRRMLQDGDVAFKRRWGRYSMERYDRSEDG